MKALKGMGASSTSFGKMEISFPCETKGVATTEVMRAMPRPAIHIEATVAVLSALKGPSAWIGEEFLNCHTFK